MFKVGPFSFLQEKHAAAYQEFLKNPKELKPLVVDIQPDYISYNINDVWCFTGLRHVDTSEPYRGQQFFEDTDGCTPVRFPPEVSNEEIHRLCEWWIWYKANQDGGVDHVDEVGKAVWNWYTQVYPEARDATKFVYGWR